MKILTNKTINSFLSKLTLDSIPVHEKVEKIQFVVQFIDWLVEAKELSPGDAIRFRNELYKKRREFTHKQAPKLPLPLKYVGFSLGILSLLIVVGGIYVRFFRTTRTPFAYSTAPVQAGRTISFQGRLTDSLGNPINAPIDITYNFYTVPTGGTPITGSTRVCTAGPDQDGVFSSLIGNDSGPSCNTELPNSIFTENPTVYLGVTVGTEPSEMTPRQQIANVGYAINSETLQGMPPGQSVSNIPFINQDGNMLIGASNPGIRSTYASSNFTISSAQATTIQSAGSGDITLSASEGGSLRFKAYNGTLEEVMTILNTGRVGIGITAPRALLDVNGDATVSGSLIAGGQIKIGEFTSPPTNLGNGSLYYDSNTNKVYFWNGTAWTDMGAGATQYFQRTLGSLAPTNITDDVNIGAVATASAIVHLPGLTNNNATFKLGTGTLVVGAPADTTKRLEILGGAGGGDMLTLTRTVGATTAYGFSLTGGGLSFHDITNSSHPFNLFGGSTNYLYLGQAAKAAGSATPAVFSAETLSSSAGTDMAGGSFTIRGGLGTGAGLPGDMFFSTGDIQASGTTKHTASTKLTIRATSGNVGVGDTTPLSLFTVGNGDLFQIDSSGRIVTLDGVAHSIDDVSGNLTLTSNSTDISLNDNVTFAGTTTLNSLAYTWPGTQSTGYILQTNGSGVLSWADPTSLTGGANLWTLANGALYPVNATVDTFIGGTASASAKFAFLNVNSGIPTASISGTTANVKTFIDGDGNIGTTNRKTLTIGNSTANNATGNVLINPNAARNVGIGTIDPQTLFHVQQAAVTSTAEEIARFNVSDDATAYFSLRNGSTTDGLFSPQLRFRGSGSTTAGNIQAMITTDTGTSPALVFTSQLASSALVTRPVLAIRNYTTDLMTVLANGSVGIGTTSPLAALDIRKTSGTTPVASISGATSKSTLVVDQSGVGDIMTASSSGLTRFVVKNNGNVGIGYTNPTYKLAVNGSILGDILYDTTNPAYYVDPSGDSVFGGGLSLVGGFTASSASVSGNLTMGNGGQLRSAYGPLNLAYKSGLDSWTTGLILQDTTGNVGIGTANPLAKLHVYDSTVLGSVAGDAQLNSRFAGSVGTNAFMHNEWLYRDANGSNWLTARLHDGISIDSSYLTPGTNTRTWWERDPYNNIQSWGDNASTYLTINAGKIGIGTTSPLATLDVRSILGTIPVASISGNTSQAALIVDQSGIGDIFTASSSGETRFVIKSNGNIGIGVSNPTSKLSIAGTISNLSGDIVFDSASDNISFSNDNLINVENIASIGQIQIGGFASPPTSIGNGAMYYDTTNNKVFYWDGTIWSEMGSKYWQRTLGSLSPQYITDALNLGAIASESALVHLPGTNNQDAWFNLGTGKLNVLGTVVADKYVDSTSNSYYVDPAGDSVLGGNLTLGDIFMIDGTPLISSLNTGSYSTITIKGSGDTTTASLCVDEGTGSSCDGKINAGTIDPPYTINGKKYATYLPSMTGVKEETTGKVLLTERNEEAKAYIKRIALGNQPEDSDLWLFAKATNLKDQIQDMTVLLSSNTNGKTWYSVDPATMVLTFYSSTPSEISYRLTAPRFDAGRWVNTRHENDFGTGFILNDRGNILAGDAPTYTAPQITSQGAVFTLIGNFIEEFTAANQALFANITAGIVTSQKIVSPLAEIDTLNVSNKTQSKEIETELLKASNSIETPRLKTNAIDIGTQSGQLAKLVINGLYNTPVVTIDVGGSATFAGTLTADAIQTQDASISGILVAKEIQSETIDTLSTQLASNSSTLASSYQELSGDINAVQQELAALKTAPLPNASYYQNLDATYNSLSITDTANIYKAYISDSLVVGSLFMEDHSILALVSDLSISSLNTVSFFDRSIVMAKNGNITSKGEITAASLAIKNGAGVTVAEIDASGSARFNEVIAKKFSLESIATQGALIADSGVTNNNNVPIPAIKTNAEVAGIGAVPQDTKEVIIYNDNVTENSLIYLTPTSENAQGQLSVSKKVTCAQNSPLPCTPYFIVSSSLLIHAETPFNWLIID